MCVCVNELLSNEYIDSDNVFLWKLRGLVHTENDAFVDGVHLSNNMQTICETNKINFVL